MPLANKQRIIQTAEQIVEEYNCVDVANTINTAITHYRNSPNKNPAWNIEIHGGYKKQRFITGHMFVQPFLAESVLDDNSQQIELTSYQVIDDIAVQREAKVTSLHAKDSETIKDLLAFLYIALAS